MVGNKPYIFTFTNKDFMKYRLKTGLAIVILWYVPTSAFAWGLLGHRIVGEIAETYLKSRTKVEVRNILGNESMAMASNWADFIKSDSAYNYLNVWHYIDFEKEMTYNSLQEYLKKDTHADAFTGVNFLVKELKSKLAPPEKKRMYLRLLIHIVADLHQPLHVSPAGDAGGNGIKLSWFGQHTNLHRVWDEHLIQEQQLSYTEYARAINFTDPEACKTWQQESIPEWIFEAYQLSKQLRLEINEVDPKLGFLYNYQHLKMLNNQLLKGAVHLAGLLNEIFS
ncbi:MAG: S1/P1 nuclease [Flavisolibacter sp.]